MSKSRKKIYIDSEYKAVWYGFLDGIMNYRGREVLDYYRELYNEAWEYGRKIAPEVVAVNGNGVFFCKLCIYDGGNRKIRERYFKILYKVYTPEKARRRRLYGNRKGLFITSIPSVMKQHLTKQHRTELYNLLPEHLRKHLVTLVFAY